MKNEFEKEINKTIMLELKKDAMFPGRFIVAGTKKTRKEWERVFGVIQKYDFSEWFIDLDKVKPISKEDELSKIISEVFEAHCLHSITYRDAARTVALRYADKQMNKPSFNE